MFLYWNQTVKPNQGATDIGLGDLTDTPPLLVHLTGACFTEKVAKNSRTVLTCELSDNKGPICVLTQGSCENQTLDLVMSMDADDQPMFSVSGQNPSAVAISGYIQPADLGDMESYADDEEMAARQAFGVEDDDDEDLPDAPPMQQASRKRNLAEVEESEEVPQLADEPPKKKQKKQKKKNKNQEANGEEERKVSGSPKQSPKNSPPTAPAGKKNKKFQTLKGGLKYKDLRTGTGPSMRKGQTAGVYYVGQLSDTKTVFDKCISGAPFQFTVGDGDVIKGWDEGLVGMQVGGKRRLVVPPKMAYGSEGAGNDIPPNASLTFTIELKSID